MDECKKLSGTDATSCELHVLNKLLPIYNYQDNVSAQKNTLERLLPLYYETGNLPEQKNTLSRLLTLYQQANDLEKQRQVLIQLLNVYSPALSLEENEKIAHLDETLAKVYEQEKKMVQAETHYRKALTFYQKEYGYTYHDVARLLFILAKMEKRIDPLYSAKLKKEATEIHTRLSKCRYPEFNKEYQTFVAQIQKAIREKWTPPSREHSNRVVTDFRIWPTGTITSARILTSSGDHEVDKSALTAINNTEALKNVPMMCTDFVRTEFTFDYEVHKKQVEKK